MPRQRGGAHEIFAQSVFGVTIAVLWVGEKLHWGQLLGSLTIMAGLVLVLSRQIQRPANAANAGTQARLLQFGRITDHASRRHTQ
jgi:hypothetical protein